MSCRELIDSLKQAADERVKQLWSEAEARAAKIKSEAAGRLDLLRREAAAKQKAADAEILARAVSDAKNRARLLRLSSEKDLSARFYEQAKALLPSLRPRSSGAVFTALARELPPGPWETVRVHPADVASATQCFPGATVTADDRISGGMEVTARGGAVKIVNTFEKRLERSWGDIQPELIRDAYNEVERAAPSADSPRSGLSRRVPADKGQRQTVPPDF